MNKEDRIKLEIERAAYRETINQLSTGDGRMEVSLDELCKYIEGKIKEIDNKLNGT